MTPQELKNSILQLAIQGKLVEQRPEEGTAEELYQQIQAEKQQLIKGNKIKKEKPLPEITEDEKPFDIPDSWHWYRITDCGIFISGYTPQPCHLAMSGTIPYFKVSDMNTEGNELWLSNTNNYLKDDGPSKTFLKNTIVYPKNGGAVFTNKKRILLQDSVVDLNTGGYYPYSPINLMYIFRFFSSIDFRQCYKGTALPTIDMEKLRIKLVPLPPLAEQKRIVAKIEELLPYVDRYELAWRKLEDFNKCFPTDLQKSILQMAIQGKLVDQRPEEGTGEELYQQIQAEKQRLIKAGTIKKEKPLIEITEDEKPFDIPESWKWVRLGSLVELITKGSSPSWQGIKYTDEGLLFVTSENVGVEQLLLDTPKYLEKRFNEIQERSILKKGDILTNIVGASIGRTAIYDRDESANINQAVCLIRLVDKRLNGYITKYLNSYVAYKIMMNDKVDTARANISLTNISDFIVPLPPIAEQERIIVKLEEILPLCEKLKK